MRILHLFFKCTYRICKRDFDEHICMYRVLWIGHPHLNLYYTKFSLSDFLEVFRRLKEAL